MNRKEFKKNNGRNETLQEKERTKKRAKKGMARIRALQTQQKKETCKKELKERMARFRENLGPERKETDLIKAKLGMAKFRQKQTQEEKEIVKEEARIGMIQSRKNQAEEIKEYQRIKEKYKRRESTKSTSKEILFDKREKCKQGMRLLREEGRLRKEKERTQRNMDELTEFGEYAAKSKNNMEYLERIEPDLVQKINEKNRAEKEKRLKERKEREELERWEMLINKGHKRSTEEEAEYRAKSQKLHEDNQKSWKENIMRMIKALDREYLAEEIDYWFEYHKLARTEQAPKWVKLRSEIVEDYNCLDPEYVKKKKEKEAYDKWWIKKHAQIVVEWEERNGKRWEGPRYRAKKIERVEAPKKLSEYEKLREKNIRERKEAMDKCNFFEELNDCKLEIGLHKS